jgi:hypothetical protein
MMNAPYLVLLLGQRFGHTLGPQARLERTATEEGQRPRSSMRKPLREVGVVNGDPRSTAEILHAELSVFNLNEVCF